MIAWCRIVIAFFMGFIVGYIVYGLMICAKGDDPVKELKRYHE